LNIDYGRLADAAFPGAVATGHTGFGLPATPDEKTMSSSYIKTHVRFLIFPLLQILAVAALNTNVIVLFAALFALVVAHLGCDLLVPELQETDPDPTGFFHLALMWLSTLLLVAILVSFAAFLQRASLSEPVSLLTAILLVAGHLGICATTIAHEFGHRSRDTLAILSGRFMLSSCLYSPLAIEHVHGHHRTVGTPDDPATAARGVGFWRYLAPAIGGTNRNAFRFEKDRLARKDLPWWLPHNRFLQGHAMSAAICLLFVSICGVTSLLAFLAAAFLALLIIEASNYVYHYGLVRVPGTPIHARHSWSAYNGASTSALLNASRHADHHLMVSRGYWRLEYTDEGPVLPFSGSVMVMMAFIQPLWFRVMTPAVADWDENFASPDEQKLAKLAFERHQN